MMHFKFDTAGISNEEKKKLEELFSAYASAKMELMSYFQKVIDQDFKLESSGE